MGFLFFLILVLGSACRTWSRRSSARDYHIMTPPFSRCSVFTMLPVRKSMNTRRFQILPFSRRISVDGRPNRINNAAFFQMPPEKCGHCHSGASRVFFFCLNESLDSRHAQRNKHESKFLWSIFLTIITNKTLSNPKLSRSQPPENIERITALLAQYKRLLTNIWNHLFRRQTVFWQCKTNLF